MKRKRLMIMGIGALILIAVTVLIVMRVTDKSKAFPMWQQAPVRTELENIEIRLDRIAYDSQA